MLSREAVWGSLARHLVRLVGNLALVGLNERAPGLVERALRPQDRALDTSLFLSSRMKGPRDQSREACFFEWGGALHGFLQGPVLCFCTSIKQSSLFE